MSPAHLNAIYDGEEAASIRNANNQNELDEGSHRLPPVNINIGVPLCHVFYATRKCPFGFMGGKNRDSKKRFAFCQTRTGDLGIMGLLWHEPNHINMRPAAGGK